MMEEKARITEVDEPLNHDSYDRNHGPIPQIDPSKHRVTVDGEVPKPLSLSIHDLATSFPQHDVTCVLQCAGNRRHTMRTTLKEVEGIDWGDGAVMNCRWKGPRLRDILMAAEVDQQKGKEMQVAFSCHQQETQEDSWYGASIALDRGISEEAERNGKPLSANNGAPVRVVVPGIAGARSRDYKVLPKEATDKDAAQKFWGSTPALQDMPINSVVARPKSGATLHTNEDGMIEVEGYALPQGADGPVTKVEVSADEHKTWVEAELIGERSKFSWVLWKTKIKVGKGNGKRIFSRATDAGGNRQEAKAVWNLRGVAYNGYGEAGDLDSRPRDYPGGVIHLSSEIVLPLLKDDLSVSERLVEQFAVAKTLCYETMHALGAYIRTTMPNIPPVGPEPSFKDQNLCKLSRSWENA
ncbi:hypothetical protein EG329_013304, partial [Mollisiaceae sp. DMI_Dod_QoI]